MTHLPTVDRDLALIRVQLRARPSAPRSRAWSTSSAARIVDVAADSVIVEVTGDEEKVDGLVELLRPRGILEMVRTGKVAMVRGSVADGERQTRPQRCRRPRRRERAWRRSTTTTTRTSSMLEGKTVAIIGYGSQGHAHALNLRDNGVSVVVGLPDGSRSRAKAQADGLHGADARPRPRRAADIVMILTPDTGAGEALPRGHRAAPASRARR